MKILLIDNYDSFTWNLFHYLASLADEVQVCRNDEEMCLRAAGYDGVVISPGPGLPAESGHTPGVIRAVAGIKPLLGVCLGHQAIVEHYGGALINLPEVLHGKVRQTRILAADAILFAGLPAEIATGHYHSWVADPDKFPEVLRVTAVDKEGRIMAFAHDSDPVMGVQFHPESVMTPLGFAMLANWVSHVRKFSKYNSSR